jgi:class 3 adenylate cyclase/tetratricopeptide (TPR) repeat protein
MDLQENLDPEAWAGIMGRFVAILTEGVRRFGGTVDKFTGDGIMALFGAPVAQEDHARRACHAARHLTTAVGIYAEELRRSHDLNLHVRLGLNSGEVVVGRVGDDLRLDPTALGHAVGLAQRMEALAEPGRIYLTEHTARLIEGWFHLTDLGPIAVKGASEPVRVFVLEAPALSPLAVRSGRVLGASTLVGRGGELAALEDALGAALEGRAQVVGIVGEAGVGKSRLCEEFARSVAVRGITVRRTTGVSHGKEIPLLPILALLRDYLGISETDDPVRAREKVAGRLVDLDPALDAVLPLLFDFLEVPDPDRPAPKLGPEGRMKSILETLHRVTERRSEREALVLVTEDLHWFDPQSASFLERLLESFPGSRTLVVTNFRPEFSALWMRHSYYRQLPLSPLRDEAVAELLGGLLGLDLSLAPLLAFVQEHTAGNPFFVEEVVRALVEDGTLVGGRDGSGYRLTRPLRDVKVPPSVQAVLAARIDRLAGEHKGVLQTAAVIGRLFSQPVLARVTGLLREALESTLRALCAAELLQEVERYPTPLFRFWHPLTQEVAYGTLLTERRSRLHGLVARAIIELEPDRLDERAALVASHFELADEDAEAAHWNDRAASSALRSDLGAAVLRWRATMRHLERAAASDENLRLGLRARTRLVQFGARTGGIGVDEIEGLYAEGRALAERLGEARRLASLTQMYGSAHWMRGSMQTALRLWVEAGQLADRTGDVECQAAVWLAPAVAYEYIGPMSAGLEICERQIEACGGNPDLGVGYVGYSPLARGLLSRARLLVLMGRLDDARQDAEAALTLARERSEAEVIAWTLSVFPWVARYEGETGGDSTARATEAVRVAVESGNVGIHVVALVGLGTAQISTGHPREAKATLSRALSEIHDRHSGAFETPSIHAHLAVAHLGCNQRELARQAADEAVAVAQLQGARVVECLALWTRATVARADGKIRTAEADLGAALALARETGAVTYEPFIREELGRLHADESELREAARLFTAIGATGHARRLRSELAGSAARL